MELTLRQAFDNDHVEAIMGKFGWVNPETNPICYGCFKNVWKGKDRYELVDDRVVGQSGSGGTAMQDLADSIAEQLVRKKETGEDVYERLLVETAARGTHTVYSEWSVASPLDICR
jgi:hypothetical protein